MSRLQNSPPRPKSDQGDWHCLNLLPVTNASSGSEGRTWAKNWCDQPVYNSAGGNGRGKRHTSANFQLAYHFQHVASTFGSIPACTTRSCEPDGHQISWNFRKLLVGVFSVWLQNVHNFRPHFQRNTQEALCVHERTQSFQALLLVIFFGFTPRVTERNVCSTGFEAAADLFAEWRLQPQTFTRSTHTLDQ